VMIAEVSCLVLERVSLTCDEVRLVWVLTGED
jgi:hypothetical protein